MERLPIRVTLVEDGLELQDAIAPESILIQRPGIDFASECIVTAQFTLVGGILRDGGNNLVSLEPEIGPFKEGKSIRWEVDYGAGFEEVRGFGSRLLIKNANLYDDGRKNFGEGPPEIDTLEIELIEQAGFIQQPEYPQRPYFVEYNSPISLSNAIEQALNGRAVPFSPQVGDPEPSRQLRIMLGKNDLGDGLYTWLHQLAYCSPDRDRSTYSLATDNQGRVRFVELDLDAAPILVLTEDSLNPSDDEPAGFKFGTGSESEQLPGGLEIEALVVVTKDVEDPEDVLNQDTDYILYRELKQTRLPRFGADEKTVRIRKWGPASAFINGGSESTQILAVDSTNTLKYDVLGDVESDETLTRYAQTSIDPSLGSNSPILAERVKANQLRRDNQGRITQRATRREAAWGLLLKKNSNLSLPAGRSLTDLDLEAIFYDYWTYLSNGEFEHTRSTMYAIAPERALSIDPKTSSAFGPPNYGKRPLDYEVEDQKAFRFIPLVYENVDITAVEFQIYGDGEFFVNGTTTFTGFGTYTAPGGAVTNIDGTSQLQTDGVFRGVGWGVGSFRFLGKRSLARNAVRDIGNLPGSHDVVKQIGEFEAALIVGRNRGYRIQLPMAMLPPGWLRPGRIIHVLRSGTGFYDKFMIADEELSFAEEFTGSDGETYLGSVYQAILLKLGSVAADVNISDPVDLKAKTTDLVSVRKDNWVWASGDNVAWVSTDNANWDGN